MNTWTEIKIAVNAADIDRASDIANVVVPYGIYIEDYTNLEQTVEDIAHIDLIDEELEKMIRPHLPRKVPCVFISSSTGQGLQELKDLLWKALQA